MEIRPHKNLLVKQWLVLLVISILVALCGLILQLLIPLKDEVTSDQVASILWPITIGVICLMWVVSMPIVILWIKNLSYHIEEDKISIRKGILTKVQQNIPYRSITDFILHRSLFDRFLSIGSLRIQTAGQSRSATGYEGQLSGLEHWQDLHHSLRQKVQRLHPTADSTTVAETGTLPGNHPQLQQILEELKAIRRALESK